MRTRKDVTSNTLFDIPYSVSRFTARRGMDKLRCRKELILFYFIFVSARLYANDLGEFYCAFLEAKAREQVYQRDKGGGGSGAGRTQNIANKVGFARTRDVVLVVVSSYGAHLSFCSV